MVTQRKQTYRVGFDSLSARNFIKLVVECVNSANDNYKAMKNPNSPSIEG